MCEQLLANAADRELRDRAGAGGVTRTAPRPTIAVAVFPGSNDDRDTQLALERLGADGHPRLARGGGASACDRGGRPPRRVLVRRLPALRRDRPLLADHGRRHALRRRGRAGARRVQRLPEGEGEGEEGPDEGDVLVRPKAGISTRRARRSRARCGTSASRGRRARRARRRARARTERRRARRARRSSGCASSCSRTR